MRFLRHVNVIILVVIAIFAGSLVIADFFDWTDAQWLTERYPLFTLLLLSLIGLHLIVTHFMNEEFRGKTETSLAVMAARESGVETKRFEDSAELESYLGKRMIEARKSICDLTWKTRISPGFSASDRQVAHQYMDKCIAEASGRIPYREIFIFSDPRRIQKLERRLRENKSGYSCRYFREDGLIPRLQFVLIDDEEAFFFASSADAPLVAFRSRVLCRVLRSFFDEVWENARPIKEGPTVLTEEVAHIRNILGSP